MSMVAVRGRLLEWGNSFGLRLSRADIERLGLKPGRDVEVKIETSGPTIPPGDVRTFDLGGDASARHDELFAESAASDLEDSRR